MERDDLDDDESLGDDEDLDIRLLDLGEDEE